MPLEPKPSTPVWLARFLAPQHAAQPNVCAQWQGEGEAGTPGADAHCRIRIALDAGGPSAPIRQAVFFVFGPPVAIACADWVCEWLEGRTIAAAQSLSVQDVEYALELVPSERYAAVLLLDALTDALAKLGVNL